MGAFIYNSKEANFYYCVCLALCSYIWFGKRHSLMPIFQVHCTDYVFHGHLMRQGCQKGHNVDVHLCFHAMEAQLHAMEACFHLVGPNANPNPNPNPKGVFIKNGWGWQIFLEKTAEKF